ncbi:MAG TPA: hypothetical protein VGF67_32685 [Ktedonobacteraceae bacterium]
MDQGQHVFPAGPRSPGERGNPAGRCTMALTPRTGAVANYLLRQNCYYHYVCLCRC